MAARSSSLSMAMFSCTATIEPPTVSNSGVKALSRSYAISAARPRGNVFATGGDIRHAPLAFRVGRTGKPAIAPDSAEGSRGVWHSPQCPAPSTRRAAVEQARGDTFSLKRYHDQVLSYGSPPVRFVRVLMLGEDIEVAN